ncbi:MAG: hypothetical protein ABIU29_02325 [Chthoniobacterales bacterium]
MSNPLSDPTLDLYDANWRNTKKSLIRSTGLAPADDAEAAIVRQLGPGQLHRGLARQGWRQRGRAAKVYNLQ